MYYGTTCKSNGKFLYTVKCVKGICFDKDRDIITIKANSIYDVPNRIVNFTGWSAFNIYRDGRLEMRFGY